MILAVSERTPTYYDFCVADASYNACCWNAKSTFPGITHSGDITNGRDLAQYLKIQKETPTEEELCVFISGYELTPITKFLETHPALLVADHVDKVCFQINFPFGVRLIVIGRSFTSSRCPWMQRQLETQLYVAHW